MGSNKNILVRVCVLVNVEYQSNLYVVVKGSHI